MAPKPPTPPLAASHLPMPTPPEKTPWPPLLQAASPTRSSSYSHPRRLHSHPRKQNTHSSTPLLLTPENPMLLTPTATHTRKPDATHTHSPFCCQNSMPTSSAYLLRCNPRLMLLSNTKNNT
ncbi:hypothetical protein LOK49_LG12G02662 [Camellia lanceoleosa]|uniref:Uncharacterized protein n=1 Tax=Camellia lanceoleosa TaxID=1840588 RepID=A0ACC0FPC2_9ERIC|nr:hypothetical protein LOK49_LG12G02662 [Camellia lanceoleosa]